MARCTGVLVLTFFRFFFAATVIYPRLGLKMLGKTENDGCRMHYISCQVSEGKKKISLGNLMVYQVS